MFAYRRRCPPAAYDDLARLDAIVHVRNLAHLVLRVRRLFVRQEIVPKPVDQPFRTIRDIAHFAKRFVVHHHRNNLVVRASLPSSMRKPPMGIA